MSEIKPENIDELTAAEKERASKIEQIARAATKLGLSSSYATKPLSDYGTYGTTAKQALNDYPRSLGFIGTNMILHDLFCASTLYAAVKLGQNVLAVDLYKIRDFADNNNLTTIVECSTRPTCLFIDGLYNDKMTLDDDRKKALFYVVRAAKRLKIPVHYYAYCSSYEELESFYSKTMTNLLSINCEKVGG